MKILDWKYIATRLASVDHADCREALGLVQRVLDNAVQVKGAEEEIAVCHALWDRISRALDVGSFNEEEETMLNALEAEMAGRTLNARLALGWLVRSASAPTKEPALGELG